MGAVLGSRVVKGTQRRGQPDTSRSAVHGWWRSVGGSPRALRGALLLALAVHAPLAPSLVPGWARRLFAPTEPLPEVSGEVVVPVDLDLEFGDEAPPEPPPPVAPEPPSSTTVEADDDDEDEDDEDATKRPPEKPKPAPPASAAPTPSASATPAPSVSASAPAPVASAPPAASSAVPGAAPQSRPVEDPSKLAGGPGSIQAQATNVMVYLATDLVRQHPLGAQVGALLAAIPQWDQLLGGTGLDPIKDFDHVWLTGPHMRDTTVVVAVIDYNVEHARMQTAIEHAMKRSEPAGRWLKTKPVWLGVLGPKEAQRVSLRMTQRAVIVAPAQAEKQLEAAKELRFGKSSTVIAGVTMKTPWRAFLGARAGAAFPMPKSISLLRINLARRGDGLVLKLEATDESPEKAATSARAIETAIEEIRTSTALLPPLMARFFKPWFEKPTFTVEASLIRAEVEISEVQLKRLLDLVPTAMQLAGQ